MSESYARQWCQLVAGQTPPHAPAALVLRHGQEFTARRSWRWRGGTHACYANAQLLARTRKDLRYVEGFATAVIPVEHAWCIDRQGRVIDPTWSPHYRPDYFGIVFERDAVRALRKVTGRRTYSLLFTWWKWRELYAELQRILGEN